jgi:hypothetical protein
MSGAGKGSYTGLYYWAVWSQRRGPEGLGVILAVLLFAFFLGVPLANFVADPQVDRLAKLAAIVAFLTLVGVGIYFTLLAFLVLALARSPARLVPQVAARLLLEARPYFEEEGLTLNDIRRLKRIAEIEQRSAAWRGNFLSYAAIGLIVLVVIALPGLQSFFMPASGPVAGRIFAGSPWSQWTGAASDSAGIIGIALVGIIVLWLAGHWVGYIRGFIAAEYANRVVLMACEELIALYEILRIPAGRELAFRERRALVERFGCRLVPRERAGLLDRARGKPFEIWMDGKPQGKWILKQTPGYSKLEVR